MDYAQFAPKGISKTVIPFIAKLLERLSNASNHTEIELICAEHLAEIEAKYPKPNTHSAYATQHQNAILNYGDWLESVGQLSDQISVKLSSQTKQTTRPNYLTGESVGRDRVHYAFQSLRYDGKFHEQRNAESKSKRDETREERILLPLQAFLDAIPTAIADTDYRTLAAGLIAATGRRLSEGLVFGEFEQTGRYTLRFTGQLKAGEERKSEALDIVCLVASDLVIDGFNRLRSIPDLAEMIEDEGEAITPAAVARRRGNSITRAVRKSFGSVVPPIPQLDRENTDRKTREKSPAISAKSLRRAYAAAAVAMFCNFRKSQSLFEKQILGHVSDAACANYEIYVAVDGDNQPIPQGYAIEWLNQPAAKPKTSTTQTARPKVPQAVLTEIESGKFGDDKKEAWLKLLAESDRAQKLEHENAVLQAEIEALKQQVERLQSDLAAAKQQQPATVEIPTAELFGAAKHNPGTAKTRIERVIEAIKVFNASLPVAEKFAITPTVIQKVSGSRIDRIRELIGEQQAPTDYGTQAVWDYNAYNGFGYHQNRGKDLEVLRQFVQTFDD